MSSAESKSKRKSDNISPITIIASIERDIQNLLLEITIRSQKDSLSSIIESLKILSKKLEADYSIVSDYSGAKPSINQSKIENSSTKLDDKTSEGQTISSYQEEIAKLKEEIEKMKKNKKNSDTETQLTIYIEEKEKLLLQINELQKIDKDNKGKISTLEECLKSLNGEYDQLSILYGNVLEKNKKNEKNISDLKNQNKDNKKYMDEIIETNQQLKEKIITLEKDYKLVSEELKNNNKKLNNLSKIYQNSENLNKKLVSEITTKDERYKIVKLMNEKLEAKSKKIIQRMQSVLEIESKANEFSKVKMKLEETIKHLTEKIKDLTNLNENLTKNNNNLENENSRFKNEINNLKQNIDKIKKDSEELIAKNNELENKFKINLRLGDTINSSTNNQGNGNNLTLGQNNIGKRNFFSSSMTNFTKHTNSSENKGKK